MELIEAFVREAVLAGADDVIVSEDDVDPETNTVRLEAVKH